MLYPKIEDCIKNVGGKYALAVIAGKRVKDLQFKSLAQFHGEKKELTCALEEIALGKISQTTVTNAGANVAGNAKF